MKKFKLLLAVSTMFIVGGLVNAQALSFGFSGQANSMEWRQISGVKAKDTNTGLFSVYPYSSGAPDTLTYLLEASNGANICSVTVLEGTETWSSCIYPNHINPNVGTKVVPWVISETWSAVNFPISGSMNIY